MICPHTLTIEHLRSYCIPSTDGIRRINGCIPICNGDIYIYIMGNNLEWFWGDNWDNRQISVDMDGGTIYTNRWCMEGAVRSWGNPSLRISHRESTTGWCWNLQWFPVSVYHKSIISHLKAGKKMCCCLNFLSEWGGAFHNATSWDEDHHDHIIPYVPVESSSLGQLFSAFSESIRFLGGLWSQS